MALCQLCETILEACFEECPADGASSYHDHYPSSAALNLSVSRGCPMCIVLSTVVTTNIVGQDPPLYVSLSQKITYPMSDKHTFFRLSFFRKLPPFLARQFDLELSDEEHFISMTPTSNLRLARSQHWLSHCDKEHSSCHARYDTDFTPTRLIDVGSRGRSPRLVETRHLKDKDIKYLALSHCWGSSMPSHAVTTVATISARLSKLPLRYLPKTFSEAIKLTRRYGIQYIWIDSLCIVQNSPADWEIESALMGKIYANCYCTIAAAWSSDCHGGLFRPVAHTIIRPRRKNGGSHSLGVLMASSTLGWWYDISQNALSRRGWTLQERELSPRVLYFTESVIHMQCRESDWNGSLIGSRVSDRLITTSKSPGWIERRCMDPVVSGTGEILWIESAPVLLAARYNFWYNMVKAFSHRQLTKSSDKFPAISGLAAEYAYLLEDRYAAGLWQKDLIRGLCWRVIDVSEASYEVLDYGPSWSWAHVSGPITYDLLRLNERQRTANVAKNSSSRVHPLPYDELPIWDKPLDSINFIDGLPAIHEVMVTPQGHDPNGILASAFIKMKVKLTPLRFKKRSTWWLKGHELAIIWDVKPDVSSQYFFMSLGKITIGLIVAKEIERDTYRRAGIIRVDEATPGSWLEGSTEEEIILV